MILYDLEPRDPVVLGDGRSIGENTMTGSLDVPFPSTLAGLVRSTIGRNGTGRFDRSRIDELLGQTLTGPLLTRVEPEPELFVPAPADAIFFEPDGNSESATSESRLIRRHLRPRPTADDELTDLPDGLEIVALEGGDLRKPSRGPKYWTWPHFESWLVGVADGPKPNDLGLDGLEHEQRVHVALQPDTRTAKEGALFRTDGVRYVHRAVGGQIARLALRFAWDGAAIPQGVVGLGGERRLSSVHPTPMDQALPKLPKAITDGITRTRRARLVLLTPAIFDRGYRPSRIDGAEIVACAVGRPAVVSGWDHAIDRPKPTRRCVAAGSVYWLELDASVKDIAAWAASLWFHNVSSDEQDRRDGFGLAALGVG